MSGPGASASARQLVLDAEARFEAADLYYGHGTDNARDEAVFLVFHALDLPFDVAEDELDRPRSAHECAAVETLVAARIERRCPAAYLTGRMWFAGLEFEVDEHVLVPRSPIAELINEGFAPWFEIASVERVLEVGTGSGCIAVALAVAFPHLTVDATDIDPAALAVARRNAARHGVTDRVRFHEADLFPPSAAPWQLLVSNPPYVPSGDREWLPAEYIHEPATALYAGADGMDVLRRLLAGARERLSPDAWVVLDLGASWQAADRAFPRLPFVWLDMAHGGEGIGLLHASDLAEGAAG